MEDDRIAVLEAQLAQAKQIADEADRKYEEVKSPTTNSGKAHQPPKLLSLTLPFDANLPILANIFEPGFVISKTSDSKMFYFSFHAKLLLSLFLLLLLSAN